ncbi:MAG: hypothetical protein ABIB71_02300 [Candidatus Woesearchaeota archaeon]
MVTDIKIEPEEKKQSLQLKKLLGYKKEEDLGDKSRWEKTPVNYVIAANTLGVELDDYVLTRLQGAKDKNHALESIYVAQHFSREAKKRGKTGLAKELEDMIKDGCISTEELGIYAMKKVEGTVSKGSLLKKLGRAYCSGKEKGENVLDIVFVPTDADNAFVYCSKLPYSLEDLTINVYTRESTKEQLESKLRTVINEELDKKIKNIGYKQMDLSLLSLTGTGFGGILTAVPIMVAISPPETGVSVSAIVVVSFVGFLGLAVGSCGIYGSKLWYKNHKQKTVAQQEQVELKDLLSKAKVNWIEDESLESLYQSSVSRKEPSCKRIGNMVVKDAIECLIKVSRESKIRTVFTENYEAIEGKGENV